MGQVARKSRYVWCNTDWPSPHVVSDISAFDSFTEKTSNPSDIPKGDVEQHIRLVRRSGIGRFCGRLVSNMMSDCIQKRKLNESLGTLARIAQAHVNRTKSSRTDGKTGKCRSLLSLLLPSMFH